MLLGLWLWATDALAQGPGLPRPPEVDVVDVAHGVWKHIPAHDSAGLGRGRRMLLLVPVVGYSQQTGGVAEVALDLAFQLPGANVSSVVGAAEYTVKDQLIFTAASSVWTAGNTWNLVGDWRVMHYPQSTYGLGMSTSTTDGVVSMDYEYLRFYQTVLQRLGPGWYAGLGYQLDDHWGIVSRNAQREVRAISRYRFGVAGRSVSSGPAGAE